MSKVCLNKKEKKSLIMNLDFFNCIQELQNFFKHKSGTNNK